MELEYVINEDKIEKYLQKFADLSPSSKIAIEEFKDEWKDVDLYGQDYPYTCLFGDIGQAIAEDFHTFDDSTRSELFSHIELGMNPDDDYLSTAVATGLIEAAISYCENHNPELWDEIERYLGCKSKKYVIAWNNFCFGTNEIDN